MLYTSLIVACTSLVLAGPSARQAAREIVAPFESLGERSGVVTVHLDERGYAFFDAASESAQAIRITDFPLPGGRSAVLELAPTSPWEKEGKAIVVDADGATRRLAPSLRLFRLSAADGGADGFLGVSREMVYGALSLDDNEYVISNGGRAGAPISVSRSAGFGVGEFAQWCLTSSGTAPPPSGGSRSSLAPAPEVRVTTVFVEVDHPLRLVFPSDQAAIDYATLLVGVSDAVYRRDLGVRITIPNGYLRVWNRPAPWRPLRPVVAAKNLSQWWSSSGHPKSGLPRTQVHALTHYYNTFTRSNNWGFARGIGVICNDSRSYGVTSVEGSFPYPLQHTSPWNADLYLFAHESGHLFGSGHTQDYSPAIPCVDGSGPDRGTIMSYCHGRSGRSVAGIGMRFHERVQDTLRGVVDRAACVVNQPIRPGDYDANRVLDPYDVAELDAYLAQGFASRGAQETFDLNGDGIADLSDRSLLVGSIVPPARTEVFNGNGVNRLAYDSRSEPLLGSRWTATVEFSSGQPAQTLVVVTADRLPFALPTWFGELLIPLPLFGTKWLVTSFAETDGSIAIHDIAVPFVPALAGATLESQAMAFAPGRIELLNGLSLTLSTY